MIDVSGVLRSCTIIFIRSSRTFSSSFCFRGRLELEQRAHARAEHQAVVRLREEVVPARLDRLHPIRRVVEGRDEDDRDARRARIALDAPADLEPGGPVVDAEVPRRHRDVEDAEVRHLVEADLHRRRSVGRGDRPEAQDVELVEQQLHVRRHVVGDEDDRRVGGRGRELRHRLRDAP
jgi:hypothetical protein